MKLDGNVALVTGASRGIGQAIAARLGAAGAVVIGTATSAAGAAAIDAMLRDAGVRGGGRELDVNHADRIVPLVQEFLARPPM